MKYPSKRPAVGKTIRVSGTSFNAANKPTDLTAYGGLGLETLTDVQGRAEVTLDIPADAVSIIVKVIMRYYNCVSVYLPFSFQHSHLCC